MNALYERDYSQDFNFTKKLKPFSREHWVLSHFSENFYLKLGRMPLPFGIKTVDHTRTTKELLRLGDQDQYYGASFQYVSEKFSLNFMPFHGNYLKQKRFDGEKEEKGYSLSLNFIKPRSLIFGVSGLYRKNNLEQNTWAGGVSLQKKLPLTSYFLGEFVQDVTLSAPSSKNFASFLKIGKFFSEWANFYLEYGDKRYESFKPFFNTVRLGLKGRVLPWMELEPFIQYRLERLKGLAPKKNVWIALQIHMFV